MSLYPAHRFCQDSGLAWREFGDPNGRPLLFFHGWPGSSAQALVADAAARKSGFRLIAPDRPGIGASPFVPGRTLLDWPSQIAKFADALECERFHVMGVSGGGPYALCVARHLPERTIAAAVVCGAPPIASLKSKAALLPAYRALLWIYAVRPEWARRFFHLVRPLARWPGARDFTPPLRALLPGPDAAILAESRNFLPIFDSHQEAFFNPDGLFLDASLYASPWGFEPEDLRVPVHFLHGLDDANFHHSLASALAARVPGARITLFERDGHFSVAIRRVCEACEWLRSLK